MAAAPPAPGAGGPPAAPAYDKAPSSRTFAASREDVLSHVGFYFGDPASPEKLKDYSEHHAMTYHFPGAYFPI